MHGWIARVFGPAVHLPPHVAAWLARAGLLARQAVVALSRHTGVPAVLVAAVALVLLFRLARRAVHVAVEIALAVALVMAATRAGWIRF